MIDFKRFDLEFRIRALKYISFPDTRHFHTGREASSRNFGPFIRALARDVDR